MSSRGPTRLNYGTSLMLEWRDAPRYEDAKIRRYWEAPYGSMGACLQSGRGLGSRKGKQSETHWQGTPRSSASGCNLTHLVVI